jgi:molybdopterin-guanine dinucleotide biosynthesis protein A
VDKGAVPVAGRALLDRVLDAVSGAERVVVVGDGPVPAGVLLTREEPAYGGPAAGVVAGVRALRAASGPEDPSAGMPVPAPVVLLLACDLPSAAAGVTLLMAAAEGDGELADVDGWSLAEPDGRLQWLFGLYRVSALERAAAGLGDPTDRSMGALLGGLRLRAVPAPASITTDIDTPEDLDRWTP